MPACSTIACLPLWTRQCWKTVILESPNPAHPFGVRGCGEISIAPPPAAIANAIHDAVGVRLNSMPMAPTRSVRLSGDRGQKTEETVMMWIYLSPGVGWGQISSLFPFLHLRPSVFCPLPSASEMPTVWIPKPMQVHTGGKEIVKMEGRTVRRLIIALDETYPGLKDALMDGDRFKPASPLQSTDKSATWGPCNP